MLKDIKTRYGMLKKVIHMEFCQKFKSDSTIKWYMNNPESDHENDGLVSLFNGISTFVGYLMLKPFSKKNSSDTI